MILKKEKEDKMTGKEIRLVLIARDDADRNSYEALLANYPEVKIESYDSIQQFKENLRERLYSGLIMDFQTLITSSTSDKEFFYSLRKGLPVINVNRSADKKELDYFIEEQRAGALKGKDVLDYFIYGICAKKNPRKVRFHTRKNVYLNVHLHLKGRPSIKTNLSDISEGGCFVIATEEPPEDKIIYLTIDDLMDKTIISAEIKWSLPWGKSYTHLPGYGLAFKEISESQLQGIRKILGMVRGDFWPS